MPIIVIETSMLEVFIQSYSKEHRYVSSPALSSSLKEEPAKHEKVYAWGPHLFSLMCRVRRTFQFL